MSRHAKLLFFAGSLRKDSWNKKLARLAARIADANGLDTTLIELNEFPLPVYDGDIEERDGVPDNAKRLRDVMTEHDGVFIASPEYNTSITPLLKNTLDWISRLKASDDRPDVFRTRPFAIGAASPGAFGGMRSLLTLRQVLAVGLGALVLPRQVVIPRAVEAFDDKGHLRSEGLQEMLKTTVEHLAVMARKLKD